MSNCFVAGIVKGLIEHNDASWHFGSTLTLDKHIRDAIAVGVVSHDGESPSVTDRGRAWYAAISMADLRQTRAYMWDNRGWSINAELAK